MREHVRDDIHLGDALHEQFAFVFAPFAIGEVAVDGAVHVTFCIPPKKLAPSAIVNNTSKRCEPTHAILKSLLDNGIIDIGQDLQPLKKLVHPDQFPPFRILAPKLARRHFLPIGNPFAHFFYFREFARTVFGEHGSRFLEALVGHLFEGDVIGGEDGGAAAAGADGV